MRYWNYTISYDYSRSSRKQGRSQTFIPGGGQAKFSNYFNLVENNLKLVLKF